MDIISKINEKWSRSPVVTLCGSTRFKDEFMRSTSILTKEGFIVLNLGMFEKSETISDADRSKLELLDLQDIHFKRIDMSDFIFVINKDGYIGESTKKEIEYAISKGVKVLYWSTGLDSNKAIRDWDSTEPHKMVTYERKYPIITLCGSTRFAKQFVQMERVLALQGFIVLNLCVYSKDDRKTLCRNLDVLKIHKQRIDMSDAIFVIDVNGYIGYHTQEEIDYALSTLKRIICFSQLGPSLEVNKDYLDPYKSAMFYNYPYIRLIEDIFRGEKDHPTESICKERGFILNKQKPNE